MIFHFLSRTKSVLMLSALFISMTGTSLNAAAPAPGPASDPVGFFESMKNPKQFLSENRELIRLLGCLMHIPYIATVDSESEAAIRASAISSMISVDGKLLYDLFRTKGPTCLAKELVYDAPKAGAYALSSVYDIIRVLDAESIAYKNANSKAGSLKMRSFKVNQSVKLALEMILRIVAYTFDCTSRNDAPALAAPSKSASFYISELADVIELWRLLGRYMTYFSISTKVATSVDLVVQPGAEEQSDPIRNSFELSAQLIDLVTGDRDEDDEEPTQEKEQVGQPSEQGAFNALTA